MKKAIRLSFQVLRYGHPVFSSNVFLSILGRTSHKQTDEERDGERERERGREREEGEKLIKKGGTDTLRANLPCIPRAAF